MAFTTPPAFIRSGEMMLIGVAAIVRDSTMLLYGGLVLNGLLFCATGVLIYYYVKGFLGSVNALVAQALWCLNGGLILYWDLSGMENVLYACLMVASLLVTRRLIDRREHVGARDALLAGVVFTLTFLARTDSLLLLGLLVFLLCVKTPRAEWLRRMGIIGACMLVGALFYAGLNYAVTGSPMQVSGTVKVTQGITTLREYGSALPARTLRGYYVLADLLLWRFLAPFSLSTVHVTPALIWLQRLWVLFAGGLVLGVILDIRVRVKAGARLAWGRGRLGGVEVALLVYTLLHSLMLVTVLRTMMTWDDLVPRPRVPDIDIRSISHPLSRLAAQGGAPTTGCCGGGSSEIRPALRVVGRCLCEPDHAMDIVHILDIHVADSESRYPNGMSRSSLFRAGLAENVPPDVRIGAWDTGFNAYFSEHFIVNLDGLMNSPSFFQDYLSQNKLDEYLTDEDISLLSHLARRSEPVPTPWNRAVPRRRHDL